MTLPSIPCQLRSPTTQGLCCEVMRSWLISKIKKKKKTANEEQVQSFPQRSLSQRPPHMESMGIYQSREISTTEPEFSCVLLSPGLKDSAGCSPALCPSLHKHGAAALLQHFRPAGEGSNCSCRTRASA